MLPKSLKSLPESRRLESWKEIASYLNRDERTAKRWEKVRGLPVHRFPGARSGVFAFTAEIDAWQRLGSPAPEAEPFAPDPIATPIPPAHRPPLSRFSAIAATLIAVATLPILLISIHNRNRGTQAAAALTTPLRLHVPPRQAEDLYLNGRYFWNKRNPADLNSALDLFKQAIRRDPNYAQAYIGLADTYSLLVEFAALPPSEAYPPAIAAARHAIAIDPSLPEAHRSLAFTSYYWSWNHALSEQEFRKAIALDPRDATTHHWFANTLMCSRRFNDALIEIEQARKLDPTSISILVDREHILSNLQGNDDTLKALIQTEKIDPTFVPLHHYLAAAWQTAGNDRNYLDELQRIANLTHNQADIEIYTSAARGFATAGRSGMSHALAETELSLYRRGLASAYSVADALASAGQKQPAIDYLKIAYRNRDTQFLSLKGKNTFPALQGDPEFQELVEKVDRPYLEQAEVARLVTPAHL